MKNQKVMVVEREINGMYIESHNIYVNVIQDAYGNDVVSEYVGNILGYKKTIDFEPLLFKE